MVKLGHSQLFHWHVLALTGLINLLELFILVLNLYDRAGSLA